jgi:tRNA1Val (adenine37-N6)-methyltransferase
MPFDQPLPDLTDDALTDRVRVLQRRGGHRYSVDDVATAWLAVCAAGENARSCLDLGCGIGSVLLMAADRLPHLRAVGIEAQAGSFALAERNIERNRLQRRVRVQFGDLRDLALLDRVLQAEVAFGCETGFDLVTGTPPYLPLGSASVSPDPQRAHARVELRGGVEAYLAAAARTLSPHGCFVMCAQDSLAPRVFAGARAAGLRIVHELAVVPMQDRKARLFSVYCLLREPAADGGGRGHDSAAPLELVLERLRASSLEPSALLQTGAWPRAELVLRDAQGARTPAARTLRGFFGLPGDPSEAPSPSLRECAINDARRGVAG